MRYTILLLLGMVLAGPLVAQDDSSTRDPLTLAQRLLNFDAEYAYPPVTPRYEVGDTAEFWVSKGREEIPSRISASLVASRPGVYLWVEEGLFYMPDNMDQVADTLNQVFYITRMRSNFEGPVYMPDVGFVFDNTIDETNLYDVSDVDDDPHLFILYARDLGSDVVVYNFKDELPEAIAPGGFSNQHEMLLVNASAAPSVSIDDSVFTVRLAESIYDFVAQSRQPGQDLWLYDAGASLFANELGLPDIRPNAANTFLQNPDISLIRPQSTAPNSFAAHGAQQLFMTYVGQRFGSNIILDILSQPGMGMAPLDAALAENNIVDPVTGATVTGDEVFADFAVANLLTSVLTQPAGDGRYHYDPDTVPDVTPPSTIIRDTFDRALDVQTVQQYGTRYVVLLTGRAGILQVDFEGQASSPRLPLPEDSDAANHFYWSGRDSNMDSQLTRTLDLRQVEHATLNFDVWYDLNYRRNYAYVEVSSDGGQTWDILPAAISSTDNHYGLAYGPGFTGRSNETPPQPAAFIGITFNADDGVTIVDVMPDGPASGSGLQPDDRIIGHDGAIWPDAPDIAGLLADHKPGDTLNLLIERDGEQLEVETTLGEHPLSTIFPDALWVPQQVDLSDYAGQEILLRFEYVSQPNTRDYGIAIDNITLPEIDFADDAEAGGDWDLLGWQRVNNEVDQRFLLQYINIGPGDSPVTRVHHLIGPEDSAHTGSWTLPIGEGEAVIFTVSGLNSDNDLPASYDLNLSEVR